MHKRRGAASNCNMLKWSHGHHRGIFTPDTAILRWAHNGAFSAATQWGWGCQSGAEGLDYLIELFSQRTCVSSVAAMLIGEDGWAQSEKFR